MGTIVAAHLSDPTKSANIFNGTGPGNSHRIGLVSTKFTGIDWTELRGQLGGSGAPPYLNELRQIIDEHIAPHVARSVFGGRAAKVGRVVLARNLHIPEEIFLSRALLWHVDGALEETIKVMIYLNDVPSSADGCMMVMLNNRTGAPFRVQPVDKVWGRYLSPPAVPKPWLVELLDRGFRPHCLRGAAGTSIFFHPNIVHRASSPHPGHHRDVLLLEIAPAKPPLLPSVTTHYKFGERAEVALTKPASTSSASRLLSAGNVESLTLRSGNRMPMVGFGTARYDWRSAQPKALSASITAYLRLGGRLLDTAQMYMNYGAIRTALEASGVPRSEVFILNKVNTNTQKTFKNVNDQARFGATNSSAGARRAVRESLQELGMSYLDAVLIHGPFALSLAELQDVWSGLLASQAAGECRCRGRWSNMGQRMILALEAASGVRPAINQIEFHPWVPQTTYDLVAWCQQQGIVIVAYGSLGGKRDASHSAAADALASKYHVTTAQVLLRWAVDQNVVVVPGATREEHIADNLRVSSFTLSADDRTLLQGERLPAGFRLTSHLKDTTESHDTSTTSSSPHSRRRVMSHAPSRRLIVDVGFNTGADTASYLAQGYNVLAVEANAELLHRARQNEPLCIRSGRWAADARACRHHTHCRRQCYLLRQHFTPRALIARPAGVPPPCGHSLEARRGADAARGACQGGDVCKSARERPARRAVVHEGRCRRSG